MSTCTGDSLQAAVTVLSLIAGVHIVLSIVLGALIAVVCYYGRLKRREARELVKREDILAREKSRDLQELESPDKLYLSAPDRNTSAVVTSTSTELPEQNTQEKEDLAPSKSSWANSMVTMETKDVKLTSPRGAESSVGEVVLRKKSRMSVISIASNISNRFRKSVDLDSEDAKRLVRETSSSERESSERDISEGLTFTFSFDDTEALSCNESTDFKNDGTDDNERVELVDINTPQNESEC